ncbi:hypothetical protein O6H91_01G076700 [Diphasiastrum complanatum]|uniref:Uncharacterized protein n=1 Tax=Diphasiastrum complanatum TaxID=34168 RepID=A0ACC2ESD7_DIPCM|nr:hypothetical protein O6H91_01G076700 [Diphasiastrum complanatum]
MGTWNYLLGSPGASGFGSKSTAEEVTAGLDLSSHTAIVTGATSGIGLETARVLAKRGARVIIPARNLKAATRVRAEIVKDVPGAKVETAELDLSSLKSVRKFAAEFTSQKQPLNILINNAGVLRTSFKLSEDGMELQFATNHLGHFLLTNLLLETMISTAQDSGIEGRIVMVSSEAHWFAKDGINFNKLLEKNRSVELRPVTYGVSKLANILHSKELARRLKERGAKLTVNALHPGVILTNISQDCPLAIKAYLHLLSVFMKTIPQGAATTCYIAAHRDLANVSGKYFLDCNEASCSPVADNIELARKLWIFSEDYITRRHVIYSNHQLLALS